MFGIGMFLQKMLLVFRMGILFKHLGSGRVIISASHDVVNDSTTSTNKANAIVKYRIGERETA